MRPPPRAALGRRSLLRGALLTTGAVITSGCSPPSPRGSSPSSGPSSRQPSERPVPRRSSSTGAPVLLAYFSRAGENYHYGGRRNLEIGNTEVLARMIRERLDCDVHRIQPADPYPADYDQTVARNVEEQNADARPAIAGALPDIDPYPTVLLASPIWNVRAPMIMPTFTDKLDFTGKVVHPLTTYAMSGLGTTERDYAASCPRATIGAGLAVRGEQVTSAGPDIDAWLRRTGLPPR
ncbi:flavodoxin [Spirillospora sp. NPDC047279]|uniref:flavodoxin n=1 Tax=Spirillospora sp. NPDC047279 TaxID=3155478 RepID=UPI00340B9B69